MILDPKIPYPIVLHYLTPPPSPVPRTTTRVLTPSLQIGGCFRVALMSSTAVLPGRSQMASLTPHDYRAVTLSTPSTLTHPPPDPYRNTSWPGAVPINWESSNIVEVAVGANHGTKFERFLQLY